MAIAGHTERRLALAVVLTAVIPLVAAIYFANTLVERAFAQAFTPELGEQLDQSLGVYVDLARALKEGMRHQADAIAAHEGLRTASLHGDRARVEQELELAFSRFPDLISLSVTVRGDPIAAHSRAKPLDTGREMKLDVRRPLGDGDEAPTLLATFAASRARFDELERASEFVHAYHQIERARLKLQRGDVYAFAALLGATIIVSVALGTMLARSVTRRIAELAVATDAVALGNLRVRVPERGNDELTDLSRNFNRMLAEVETNRARIEFLQQMSSWQEMARRLAHEIKNPLTPIVLAIQECHRRYDGSDARFRKLLDTTLEIVEDEVGTLRRLVSEFGAFARLPRAELTPGDLRDLLRDERDHLLLSLEDLVDDAGSSPRLEAGAPTTEPQVSIGFDIGDAPMPAAVDRQMLHQVLRNVLRNAREAIIGHRGTGRIDVSTEVDADGYTIRIDDDGPGVPESMRATIFDPYVTTKADGTGLGLAIVKKIMVEHGGTVDVVPSPSGGASFRLRIPRFGTARARAPLELPLARPSQGQRLRRA